MALDSSLRKSRNLQFNLVSSSVFWTPIGSRGRGVSARFTTCNCSGMISIPFLAILLETTLPLTRITSSWWSLAISITMSGLTFVLGAATWTIPAMSRRRMKDIPPNTRTSWTQPARTTSLSRCSLSWEVSAVRLRWDTWLSGLAVRDVQLGIEQEACSFRASFSTNSWTSKPKGSR